MAESAAAAPVVRAIFDSMAAQSDAVTAESIGPLQGSLIGLTLKPARYGGRARPIAEFIAEVCELAALDASLGWLAATFNTAAYEVATLPQHAADIVWGPNPNALITTASRGDAALGRDLHLTGRWESVIGSEFADWLLLPADDGCRVLLPRSLARLEPVHTRPGLAAAGICDVTVSDSALDDRQVFTGEHQRVGAAGAAAAVVGSADGVWRRHVGRVRALLATSYGGDDVTNAASAQVAWAASDIDAAKLQLSASLDESGDGVGEMWTYRQAVARARGAADRLLANSKHALDEADPVARQWQDVQAGCRVAPHFFDGS